jgi:hypothetical protein
MRHFEWEKRACKDGGRSQERWPTRSGGLRICGNPIEDVSHASNFRSALRCILPIRVYNGVRLDFPRWKTDWERRGMSGFVGMMCFPRFHQERCHSTGQVDR